MPFTFAHPAVVLPLSYLPKKWISLTGLIIGSMAPDFEYFLRMRIQSDYSHTWLGVFWFDLPLVFLAAFIFHYIIRNSLIDNLPNFLYQRFAIFKSFDWYKHLQSNLLIIVISMLIGIISHILWDGFTHPHGLFVEQIPILQESTFIANHPIKVFKLLQHGSTLIGGLIIAIAIWRMPIHQQNPPSNFTFIYWIALASIAIVIIALRLLFGLDYHQYGHLIATAIAGGFIALILSPLLLRIR